MFLDERVLCLASHAADVSVVSREGTTLVKLVEATRPMAEVRTDFTFVRAIPESNAQGISDVIRHMLVSEYMMDTDAGQNESQQWSSAYFGCAA